MKLFMRGGGRSGVSSPLPTPKLDGDVATKALPTPSTDATATHATTTQAATQATTTEAAAKLAAKQAVAKQFAARQAAAKQFVANKAEVKQAAAKEAALRQPAARQEEFTRLEAERQEEIQVATTQAAHGHGEDQRAEEELVNPANVGRIELIPNVFWFSKPAVAAGVTTSFRAHYNFPYMNWSEVPITVRDRWFLEFKRMFTWKPEYDDMVRRDYEKKGLERLKDQVNKAAKVPLHKRVGWMSDKVRAEFVRKREDPEFKKRSVKAKQNRYSNQFEASFDPGHRQGSISTIEVAERLAAQKNGVLPLAADVYEITHGFEMPGGENTLIGDKPKKIMAEYKEKLAEYQDKGVKKAPDEVYLEVVGGPKKGGKVYGLGSASSMFYEAGSSSQTNSSPHVASIISQLSSQLEECKKMVEESQKIAEESKKVAENSLKIAQASQEQYEKEKDEWKKEKEEWTKEKEELVSSMAKTKKAVVDIYQLLMKERSFNPRDH